MTIQGGGQWRIRLILVVYISHELLSGYTNIPTYQIYCSIPLKLFPKVILENYTAGKAVLQRLIQFFWHSDSIEFSASFTEYWRGMGPVNAVDSRDKPSNINAHPVANFFTFFQFFSPPCQGRDSVFNYFDLNYWVHVCITHWFSPSEHLDASAYCSVNGCYKLC